MIEKPVSRARFHLAHRSWLVLFPGNEGVLGSSMEPLAAVLLHTQAMLGALPSCLQRTLPQHQAVPFRLQRQVGSTDSTHLLLCFCWPCPQSKEMKSQRLLPFLQGPADSCVLSYHCSFSIASAHFLVYIHRSEQLRDFSEQSLRCCCFHTN